MTAHPQMAFGLPIYNQARQLERTLESILNQSVRDFGVVAVDDCSSDGSPGILARYATNDARLQVIRNERRLGHTRNWLKAYHLCRHLFPTIEFFAWGSDHDVWHPHWLRLLIDELRAQPDASLAWSWWQIITGDGDIVSSRVPGIERGMSRDRRERMSFAAKEALAGSMIYGLIRVAALERTSGLRMVLAPDRLLIAELAVMGPFAVVPEFLWHRRYFRLTSRERQRRNIFPEGAPLYAYLPITLQHSSILLHDLAIRRLGAPAVSAREGKLLAWDFALARWSFRREQRARTERMQAHRRRKRLTKREKKKTIKTFLGTLAAQAPRSGP